MYRCPVLLKHRDRHMEKERIYLHEKEANSGTNSHMLCHNAMMMDSLSKEVCSSHQLMLPSPPIPAWSMSGIPVKAYGKSTSPSNIQFKGSKTS